MKIGLFHVDKKQYPNIALMKISTFHKQRKDEVEWFLPLWKNSYDLIYASKIFTFSKNECLIKDMIKGGTGFDLKIKLPKEIDDLDLDYSLYPGFKQAIGFLTRGCIRKCPECIVPEKEGYILPYRDIEEIMQGRNEIILLDNNILASDHGIKQIEKIIKLRLKVDFNQGLDARLIDKSIAKLLSQIYWLKPLRMACDNLAMIKPVENAILLLREFNCKPQNYFIYILVKEIPTALERIKFCRRMKVDPFAQPYIFQTNEIPEHLKIFARWVNHKAIFYSISYDEYNNKYKNYKYKKEKHEFTS